MEKLSSQFLKDTGAKVPIICGPMYPGSNPELVAAVSNSGGFGVVQPLALTILYGHDFRKGLQLIKKFFLPYIFTSLISFSSTLNPSI